MLPSRPSRGHIEELHWFHLFGVVEHQKLLLSSLTQEEYVSDPEGKINFASFERSLPFVNGKTQVPPSTVGQEWGGRGPSEQTRLVEVKALKLHNQIWVLPNAFGWKGYHWRFVWLKKIPMTELLSARFPGYGKPKSCKWWFWDHWVWDFLEILKGFQQK